MFSTCFYTSFLSRDFPFCTDSLHNCSFSHLSLHTKHLFAEIAYQITQVPQEFDTRFLPFYTTCAIRYTCQKRTRGSKRSQTHITQNTKLFIKETIANSLTKNDYNSKTKNNYTYNSTYVNEPSRLGQRCKRRP